MLRKTMLTAGTMLALLTALPALGSDATADRTARAAAAAPAATTAAPAVDEGSGSDVGCPHCGMHRYAPRAHLRH